MTLQEQLQAARENVNRLQAQKQQVDTVLVKWTGIYEYLAAQAQEEAKAAKATESTPA